MSSTERRSAFSATLLVALLLVARGAAAQLEVPATIDFQGRLVNKTSGAPLAGPVQIDVSIWDTETSPPFSVPLYGERHSGVALRNGVFSLAIGSGTPLVGVFGPLTFSGLERWLEIAVDGETLSPRQPFSSVAYSFRTQSLGAALYVSNGLCNPASVVTVNPTCVPAAVQCGQTSGFLDCQGFCAVGPAPTSCPNIPIGKLNAP